MTDADVLQVFLDTKALLNGHFELRSGLHSDQFFQCAKVLQQPRIAARLCEALVAKLQREIPGLRVDGVIAPAMGGLFVGHEVAKSLDTVSIFAEKQDGALVLRRGFEIPKGASYVVAEDVITRGGRVQETIDIVEGRGGRVAAVAVLVDRSGGKAAFKSPTVSLLRMAPVTFDPGKCPLCARGLPLEHPGS
jgi:orotate phosphoribosyltransferase